MKTTTKQPGRNLNAASLAARRIPWLEPLENRLLFSTYTVTTLGDAAGTITPNGVGKFNATTLRAAITAANAHAGADTINFAAAVTGAIHLGTALPQIADTLTLAGPGAAKLTVQRSAAATTDFSIFYVQPDRTSTVSGLTLAGGTGTPFIDVSGNPFDGGGGIYNAGTLTVTNSTLSDNSATNGGGINNYYGTLTVTNTTFAGNSAKWGGGVLNFGGTLTVTTSTLTGNSADVDGGALYNIAGGTLTVTNSTLTRNLADDDGGGIFNYSGMLTVTNSTITGNSAEWGGGGISNSGTLTVTNCTISGNSAHHSGGISNDGGTLTVASSTLSGNSAQYGGGGISNGGPATVTNSTLSGNYSTDGFGGGISNSATLTLANSNLSGNSAYSGGGIFNYDGGTLTVANSTLSGNSAALNHGGGGGITNFGTATAANSTLSGNSAAFGGGIHSESTATTTVANSIVVANVHAGTTTFSDVNGILASTSSHNLIGTGGSGGLVNGKNGNKVGVTLAQLKLGPLANNGGPTQTMALLPGSIAINAGSNAKALDAAGKPLTTDQRGTGFARIVVGTVDVGAFEVQSPVVTGKGSVVGVVFKDLNGNRIQDASESGVKGWLVWADLNKDGRLNYNEPRTVTNSQGKYALTNVPAGYQLLRLEKRIGWQQTMPRGGGAHGPTILTDKLITGWHFGVKPILG